MNGSARRIARLGALAALGTGLLLAGHAVPVGRLGFLAAASLPVCAAVMLYGPGWAAGVFVVTAGLGLILFPGAAAVGYAAFFGYYPIAKSLFERPRSRAIGWALKYALYAAAFAALWLLARTLFPAAAQALPWYLIFAAGAAVFGVYDWAYSLLIGLYQTRIARHIS